MVKELPISTDPYEQSAEPHPDRLGQGDSKTPLMTGGSSGKLRILVLMGLAQYSSTSSPRCKSSQIQHMAT